MVKQEFERSCGQACARQLLLDNIGTDIPESRIRELSFFDPSFYTDGGDIVRALEQLDAEALYKAGSTGPEHLDELLRCTPFIALVRFEKLRHFIIVDGREGNFLRVRDPAGVEGDESACGAEGLLEMRKFVDEC